MASSKESAPKPISLNEEQQRVVDCREGVFQVLAGPGAGKSASLVARFSALVKEGVSPDNLLSLSFTKTAARNLKDRVEQQVGKLSISRTGAGCSTFHSLALTFAQTESSAFGFELAEFPLATEPVANKLSGDAARRYEIDARTLRPYISLCKRSRVHPPQAVKDAETKLNAKELKMALAYKDYDKRMREAGVLDFDSLILQMVEILSKRPDIGKDWSFDFVQVDEAQDCAKIEWNLIKLVSGKSLLAVGDVSQGVYQFRGSDPTLFANMSEMFPGTQTLFLSRNYRSTPEIVDFIRPISQSKDLAERFHTTNQSGPAPEIKGFRTPAEEAAWVVADIRRLYV